MHGMMHTVAAQSVRNKMGIQVIAKRERGDREEERSRDLVAVYV